ncbi:proton-conducting membrane transporter [Halobacteriales archaeon SW_7_68_16]|nr:MAG: proton-conducting membrane transporter [Halobacteriales archaeon SW_7_68_16]
MLPGLAAVALFAVMAVTFLTAPFGSAAGFPDGASITASIGYAMFNLGGIATEGTVSSEGFLVAFEIVDLVLVAALVAAVMLARREGGDGGVALTDGGRDDGESGEGTERTTEGDR